MSDRILSDQEVALYETRAAELDTCNSSYPALMAVVASHRLLAARVEELENRYDGLLTDYMRHASR